MRGAMFSRRWSRSRKTKVRPQPQAGRCVPHWDTVGVPAGHGGCTSGTRWVYQWDPVGAPAGHGGCTSGTRWVYQRDTVGVPVGHGGCTSGTRWVYQWDTEGVPAGHGGCTSGTRRVYRWAHGARSRKRFAPSCSTCGALLLPSVNGHPTFPPVRRLRELKRGHTFALQSSGSCHCPGAVALWRSTQSDRLEQQRCGSWRHLMTLNSHLVDQVRLRPYLRIRGLRQGRGQAQGAISIDSDDVLRLQDEELVGPVGRLIDE